MKGGRKAFLETLEAIMRKDPKVILIYGDVGFSFMEGLIEKYPNQTLNAGIAEQNMMGMAAGLARVGWKPYVYTMVNFILARPYEFVRNDIAFANANVKLFGVKGSEAYKFLGISHNMFDEEEKNLTKHLPNLKCYWPENEYDVNYFMKNEYIRSGPSYMRI